MFLVAVAALCFAAAYAGLPTPVRIVGGEATTIKEHPHQISIERHKEHICGGSILTHRHILTAAHCIYGNFTKPLVIRLGSTYRGRGQKFTAIQLKTHPSYDRYLLLWDVGVAVVGSFIPFSSSSKPIALIRVNEKIPVGEMLTVSGWGWHSYNATTEPTTTVLHAVRVPLISSDLCNKTYSGRITSEMLCAGGDNKGFYMADSGGPLINSRKELVGMVSFINLKSLASSPGVYTNVASKPIRKFIDASVIL